MTQIIVDGDKYEVHEVSERADNAMKSLKFTNTRLEELNNTLALLQRAKISYVGDLKQEMLSRKAGFLFEDNY